MKVFYTKTYNVWNDNTRKHDIVAQAAKKLDYDEVSLFNLMTHMTLTMSCMSECRELQRL